MTLKRFFNRPTHHDSKMTLRRTIGIAWLAFWLLAAGTFGYRALTHETAGEAAANIGTAAGYSEPQSFKPIEKIQVGERVALSVNPTEGFDESLGTKIHPQDWRRIVLQPDEQSRVVLLRPEWWVNERILPDNQTMSIAIPEVGIYGDARIISIDPCPGIPAGQGRVVIGTFSHLAPETIRLTIDGIADPIRCTPNHATWSADARDFVEAQDLHPGTHVLCRDGTREVLRVDHLPEPIEVFNLEVFGQHVYQITTGAMLVHNAGPSGSGKDILKIDDGVRRSKAAQLAQHDTITARVKRAGQPDEIVDVPIDNLRSPKTELALDKRLQDTMDKTKKAPVGAENAIEVVPMSAERSGLVPIRDVQLVPPRPFGPPN